MKDRQTSRGRERKGGSGMERETHTDRYRQVGRETKARREVNRDIDSDREI